MAVAGLAAVAVAGALCLSGCSNLGYYWHTATGHLGVMSAARPVEEWLGNGDSPQRLKERLALSQRIRNYAVAELRLPDNSSYRRYADLRRGAVVWNVVAAPAYSVTLRNWCFPVTGCVTYRGYFDEALARAGAAELAARLRVQCVSGACLFDAGVDELGRR
jgi:predicted aminopeptidase